MEYVKYPRNSYAAREMRRRRIEARERLKTKIKDVVLSILLVVCFEAILLVFLFM